MDDQGPGNYEILVGRCDYFNPVERAKLSADADRFVEQMDEDEWGNGFEPDDAIYSMKEGAKKAFEEALGAWAFHYVYSNYWSLANDEKVNITVEDDEDEEVPTDPVHGERGGKEEEAAPKGNSE